MKMICTCRWPLKHLIQASDNWRTEFSFQPLLNMHRMSQRSPWGQFFPPGVQKMTPKGVHRAMLAVLNQKSHEPLSIQRGYHTLVSQGVIWLASSGLTSREVNSEKSAGSQYWASPAAWESSQAKPSFSRWSWKYESPGKNTDSYLWTSFKSVVVLLILGS